MDARGQGVCGLFTSLWARVRGHSDGSVHWSPSAHVPAIVGLTTPDFSLPFSRYESPWMLSAEALDRAAIYIARPLGLDAATTPVLDARLDDGSRVSIRVPPACPDRAQPIRKKPRAPFQHRLPADAERGRDATIRRTVTSHQQGLGPSRGSHDRP